jgi:hypothetical protein
VDVAVSSRDRFRLAVGLAVLLALGAADAWVKHRTVIGPPGRLQVGASGRVQPLDPARAADAQPDRLFWDDDAYFWLRYTGRLVESGGLRVGWSALDNAPFGREVHWSSAPVWLLAGLRRVASPRGADGSLEESLASAALWVHPLLFAVIVVGSAVLMAQRVPWFAALALSSHLLLSSVLSRDLSYGTLDHHAFLLLCLAGTLLCVMVGGSGFVTAPEAGHRAACARARRWMVASGICAGCGLWIQAAFDLPLLAGVAAGGLAAALVSPGGASGRGSERTRIVPELWRAWGFAAAAASLAFYLIEHVPGRLGMRLEVNHPLHALAAAALGELLCRLLRLRLERSRAALRANLPAAAACVAAGSLLPAAALLGPADWLWLRDPFLQRVHSMITAYQPASALFRTSEPVVSVLLKETGLLPLAPIAALALVFGFGPPRASAHRWAPLLLPLAPAVVAAGLFVKHARNSSLSVVALTCFAFGVAHHAGERWRGSIRARRLLALVAALALAVNGWVWLQTWEAHYPFVGSDRFAPDWVQKMAFRDVAWAMRGAIPSGERVALADCVLAPSLIYFGDFAVTSSLYWENRDGLWDTATFFAARDDGEARRVVERRGIRYVVMWATPAAVRRWHLLRYGTAPEDALRRTLAHRLAAAVEVPPWLEDVTARFGPVAPAFHVKVFRVRAARP